MKLSALEIKSQEFRRALRGVDEGEVQSFLDMVATQWQELQDDLRRAEEKTRELQNKIVHYQKIEEALQEALTSAKASSKATVAEAERRAQMVIEEAQSRSRSMARESEDKIRSLHGNLTSLSQRRKEVVARMRAFLRSELELLDDYSTEPFGKIPDLPDDMRFGDEHGTSDADQAEPGRHNGAASSPSPQELAETTGVEYVAHSEAETDAESFEKVDVEDVGVHDTHTVDAVEDGDDTHVEDADDSRVEYVDPEFPSGNSDDPGETEDHSERGPVEHQQHKQRSSGFESEPQEIFADDIDEYEDPDEFNPTDTESRIRRILDNLG